MLLAALRRDARSESSSGLTLPQSFLSYPFDQTLYHLAPSKYKSGHRYFGERGHNDFGPTHNEIRQRNPLLTKADGRETIAAQISYRPRPAQQN